MLKQCFPLRCKNSVLLFEIIRMKRSHTTMRRLPALKINKIEFQQSWQRNFGLNSIKYCLRRPTNAEFIFHDSVYYKKTKYYFKAYIKLNQASDIWIKTKISSLYVFILTLYRSRVGESLCNSVIINLFHFITEPTRVNLTRFCSLPRTVKPLQNGWTNS
jgi:hypothetical protein